jgi:Mg2+ and Co2+ transporter CorA
VLSSLETFAFIANESSAFIFNQLSFNANQAMTWLTLFTVVFLPITAITGYYVRPSPSSFSRRPLRRRL